MIKRLLMCGAYVALAIPACLGCLVGLLQGCATYQTDNPSFEPSIRDAKEQLKAMKAAPVARQRPLVFVGPFFDPFVAELYALSTYKHYFTDTQMTGVSFTVFDTFDSCRRKVLKQVDKRFPSDDVLETVEVDVVAFSMGGVVARYAALAPDPERGQTRRLKINRLFTIASPHRGAHWAPLGTIIPLAKDMRKDSAFLARLDAALPELDYTLISYIRLGDWIVGEHQTAPPGQTPIWVSNRPFQLAHIQAPSDPRIEADILRQLRGDESAATVPRSPVPGVP